MSQPDRSGRHDPDPLLAFFAEVQASNPVEPGKPVAPAEPLEPIERVELAATRELSATDRELRQRLARAERQIERTQIDISTLKSDLATLVGAVDDIKKRMSRPTAKPAPVAALPQRKLPGPRAIALIVTLLTAGAALWGLI